MDEIEQTNKVKILEELQKNARASLSELAEKTGLSRQTVAKTINHMEKNKEIWGYTAIFDPKLVGKKQFIFLAKLDLSVNTEDFLRGVTNTKLINEHEQKQGFKLTMFLHGNHDFLVIFWAKGIIEAKKNMNTVKGMFGANVTDIELLDVLATFRYNGIGNPKMVEEWTNLLI